MTLNKIFEENKETPYIASVPWGAEEIQESYRSQTNRENDLVWNRHSWPESYWTLGLEHV